MSSLWKALACKNIMSESSSLLFDHTQTLVIDRHAVVPKSFRIVATARSISPENYATYSNDGLENGHS